MPNYKILVLPCRQGSLTLYQTTKSWTGPNSKHVQMTKINFSQNLNLVLGKVENILGKGENVGYQYFLIFPKCFQEASSLGVVKSRDCVVKSCRLLPKGF